MQRTSALARRLTIAVAGAAVIVAPIAVTAPAVQAAPTTSTAGTVGSAVSLTGPTIGTFGTTIQLTGTVWRYGTTTKLAGATVWLQRANHGKGNWGNIKKASSTSAGTFGFNVVQTAAYDYRAYYAGSPTYTAAWSPVRYPAVRQKVVPRLDQGHQLGPGHAAGHRPGLPAPPAGTPVWLQRYDKVTKTWKNYISGRSTGGSTVVVKGNVGGSVNSYRLYAPQRGWFAAGGSAGVAFTHYKWRGAFRSAPVKGGTAGAVHYVYDASESPQRSEAELAAAVGGKAWFDVSTAGCIKVDFFGWNVSDQGDLGRTNLFVQILNVAGGATLRGPYALAPDRNVTYAFNLANVAKTRFQTHDDAVANGQPYAYFDIGLLCAN
jgi:hypothetical protein